MADEKVVFDVVIDGDDTPIADTTGVSYRIATGTRSHNEVKVYDGSDGAIENGQMTILVPSSDIDDQLILSGDITPTDIFDPLAKHLRGVGVVTGTPDVPDEYCLVVTGSAGQSEHGVFENPIVLSSAWKVRLVFDLDDVTETNGYITTGVDLKILLAPGIKRVQVYYSPTAIWYNIDFNTDFGTGTGQHTLDIYQDGGNVSATLDVDVETKSKIGVVPAPTFTHIFTNPALQEKFVGKVLQLVYYSGGVEVRKYSFNSQSTIEELDDIESEAVTFTNVISGSWVTCDGGIPIPDPDPDPVDPPVADTYLEYKNTQYSRYIDPAVADFTANIGYPRVMQGEGPDLVELESHHVNYEGMKKWDAVHIHNFDQVSTLVAGMQAEWDRTKHLHQVNIQFLDRQEGADDGTLYQARNPSFIFTGPISSPTDGTMFAGHWLYQANTTTSGYLSNTAMSVDVTSTAYMSAGKHVVICNADWSNAEHLRISNIVGNKIYFDLRGYRSDQLAHNNGSKIAVHVHFNPSAPDDYMYNITTKSPVDGAGRQCNDWFALWCSENYTLNQFANEIEGIWVDGIAFDIDFKDQTHAADFDNDGDNDTPNDINSNWLWEGLDTLYDYCRSYMPTKSITAGLSRSPGYGHNHGTQEEGWPVDIKNSHDVVQDDDYDDVFNQIFSNYNLRIREARQPYSDWHVINKNVSDIYADAQLTGTQIFDTDSCAHRVALTTALMGPAMYCQQPGSTAGWYTGRSYDPWYDEFSVDWNTGIAWKAGEWYDRIGATTEERDAFDDVISGKHWLGQPLGDYTRVFNDTDFDADDVIYDHPFTTAYTGWVGTQIPLSIEDESLKCGEHLTYQSQDDNAKVVGPNIALTSSARYTFIFKAKTTTYREIVVRIGSTVKRKFDISDEWRNYVFCFQATSTSMYTQFSLGKDSTIVWIKDIKVFPGEINAFQREFDHGIVLANVNFTAKTFPLPANTYKRISGYMSPSVNSGADVGTSIVIPKLDGIILVKKVPEVPASSTYLEWENNTNVKHVDGLAEENDVVSINAKGFPHVSLSGGPAPAEMTTESLKRYDLVLSHAYDQTQIAAAQVGWEHMRHLRQINLEYLDWDGGSTSGIYQARQPSFSYTGAVSHVSNGTIFAGHWLYRAGTVTTQATLTGDSSFFVAAAQTGKFTVGQYVCIHDGTFWPAEHFKITSINGSTGEIDITDRGYRGAVQYHPSGSSVSMHSLGARDTTSAENFMFNMSSKCPRDAEGRKCNQWMAYWLEHNNTLNHLGNVTSGLSTQGIGVDIDFKSQLHAADYNNDGTDDVGADEYSNWLWEGLDEFYRECRRIMPTLTHTGGVSRSPGYAAYNGCQEENWPFEDTYEHTIIDEMDEATAYKRFDWVMNNYITRMREVVGPQTDHHCLYKNPSAVYGDTPGLANDNKALRLSLTTCLMGNAMFGQQPGANSTGRSHDPWYDEFSVDTTTGTALKAGEWYDSGLNGYSPDTFANVIANKHWLGQPVEDFQRDFVDGDFQSGDVIYNHPFSSGYSGWAGTQIPLAIENNSLKCGKHSAYQADINNAKVTGPNFTTATGTWYTVVFKARAKRYRNISIQLDAFQVKVDLTEEWRNYSASFKATDTSTSFYFGLGLDDTDVWFKDIKVFPGEINAFRREFDNGIVLANANNTSHTFTLPASTYKRILGYQDATVNSGAAVGTSIVIDSHDGIILVKI